MMEDFYEQIEDYLDGLLKDEALQAFESAVATDAELRERLALHQALRRSMEGAAADRGLEATLKSIGSGYFKGISNNEHRISNVERGISEQKNLKIKGLWWGMAALAAVSLTVLAVLWWPKTATTEQLYAEYRAFPQATFTTQGAGDSTEQLRQNAAQAFNRGRYDEALMNLRAYLETSKGASDQEARFFLGLSRLETGDFDAAIAIFTSLSQSSWRDEADWYLALTYLKAGRVGECKGQLARIGAENGHYKAAGALLGKLK
jgi:TolA-binding protein